MNKGENLEYDVSVREQLKKVIPKIKENAEKEEPKYYSNGLKDELRDNLKLLEYFKKLDNNKMEKVLSEWFDKEIAAKITVSIKKAYQKDSKNVKLMIKRLNGEVLSEEDEEKARFTKQGRKPKHQKVIKKKEESPEKINLAESNYKFEESETCTKPIAILNDDAEKHLLELKDKLDQKIKENLEKDSKIKSLEFQVEELQNKLTINSSISQEAISKEISLEISSFFEVQEEKKKKKVSVEIYSFLLKDVSKLVKKYELVDITAFVDEEELSPNSKIVQALLFAILNKYKFLSL